MRILFALTYYRPHVSGLTIHIQRIAEALAARHHQVTVLTSRYRPDLAADEYMHGVHVVRVPVWWRPGKGVVSPGVPAALARLAREHDVIVQSLPANPDAVWWSRRQAKQSGRPLALVYACGVRFGGGIAQRALERACRTVFAGAIADADGILVLSSDYADHQPALRDARHKIVAIPPPVAMPEVSAADRQAFRERWQLRDDHCHVLLAARMAAEKGVEYLLDALPIVAGRVGHTRLVVTADQSQVIGERAYRKRLHARLAACDPPVVFAGELATSDLAACFAACDVTVLPSVNETESFGMVQVESMLCGTPVVASDLPGVREPVTRTGMGVLVRPAHAASLADGLATVVSARGAFVQPRAAIQGAYDSTLAIEQVESWLADTAQRHRRAAAQHRARIAQFRAQATQIPAFRALVRSVEAQLIGDAGALEGPTLDFGCGDAHFAAALGRVFDVGIDADPHVLADARHRSAHRRLVCADGRRLPFGAGTFATVVANSTLEHIDRVDEALAEIARVLRPGGRLLVTMPSHRFAAMLAVPTLASRLGLASLARWYGRWFNRHSRHVTTDAPDQGIARFARHGLIVSGWRYYLSPRAHAAFDALHYAGVSNLASRRLTGQWVAGPLRFAAPLYAAAFAGVLAPTPEGSEGPYVLYDLRRGDAPCTTRGDDIALDDGVDPRWRSRSASPARLTDDAVV